MKPKNLKLGALLLLEFGLIRIHAQEATSASAGNASGNGGSSSYTLSQVFYTSNFGASGSVVQGVQQTYEISVVNEIKEIQGISLQCSVFPNPTTNQLNLKIEGGFQVPWFAYLYDNNGKLIENRKIEESKTSIDMSNLVSDTYFLKIMINSKDYKTFKIIKY